MRAYFFTNFYMSSIQHGIQPAHCIVDMIVKYSNDQSKADQLYTWAREHKTMIVLNGGANDQLTTIREFMDSTHNPYPWDFFREDTSMEYMVTCVGIVLPERIYAAAALLRERGSVVVTTDDNINVISNRPPYKNTNVTVGAWGVSPLSFKLVEYTVSNWELELITGMNKCGMSV